MDTSFRPFSYSVPYHFGLPPSQGAWFYPAFEGTAYTIGTEDDQVLYYDSESRSAVFTLGQYDHWSYIAEGMGIDNPYKDD